MHKLISAFTAIWLMVFSLSCIPKLTFNNNKTIKKDLPQYWLTKSLYAGPFYDHPQLRLIDYRPFFAIDDAKTLDGITLFPPKSDSIISPGTLVRILDIDYPDFSSNFNRPLFSPRKNIWVFLEIARERGQVSVFHNKTHVMVLPLSVKDEAQVKEYVAQFLSNKDPNAWLLTQEKHIREAILEKRPVIGMNKKQVLSSLGPPKASEKIKKQELELNPDEESWEYHQYLVIFAEEKVSKFKRLSGTE